LKVQASSFNEHPHPACGPPSPAAAGEGRWKLPQHNYSHPSPTRKWVISPMLELPEKSHHIHMPLRWLPEQNDTDVARSGVHEPPSPRWPQATAFGEERPSNDAQPRQSRREEYEAMTSMMPTSLPMRCRIPGSPFEPRAPGTNILPLCSDCLRPTGWGLVTFSESSVIFCQSSVVSDRATIARSYWRPTTNNWRLITCMKSKQFSGCSLP
jgi:hypothetical protein